MTANSNGREGGADAIERLNARELRANWLALALVILLSQIPMVGVAVSVWRSGQFGWFTVLFLIGMELLWATSFLIARFRHRRRLRRSINWHQR
jgi:hypothetical protein